MLEDNREYYESHKALFQSKNETDKLNQLQKFYDLANKNGYRISVSPYSESAYALNPYDEITWGYKPENSLRLSDHWNFISKGELHEETDDSFLSDGYKVGRYENGMYINPDGKTWFTKESVSDSEIFDNPDIQKWFEEFYGEDIEDMPDYSTEELLSGYTDYVGANYSKTLELDGDKETIENIVKIGDKYYSVIQTMRDDGSGQVEDVSLITNFEETIK